MYFQRTELPLQSNRHYPLTVEELGKIRTAIIIEAQIQAQSPVGIIHTEDMGGPSKSYEIVRSVLVERYIHRSEYVQVHHKIHTAFSVKTVQESL